MDAAPQRLLLTTSPHRSRNFPLTLIRRRNPTTSDANMFLWKYGTKLCSQIGLYHHSALHAHEKKGTGAPH